MLNKKVFYQITILSALIVVLSIAFTNHFALNKSDAKEFHHNVPAVSKDSKTENAKAAKSGSTVEQASQPAKQQAKTTAKVSKSTTAATQPAAAKPSKKVTEKAVTYITSLKSVNGNLYGSFDYIQWFTGKNADQQVQKACGCKQGAPDGYFIRNDNPKIRQFPISKNAEFVLQTRDPYKIKWNEKVTKAQFIKFANNKIHVKTPYHLQVENGVVTKITEQYIP